MRYSILLPAGAVVMMIGGCVPQMSHAKLHHEATTAAVDGDSLYVTGWIKPIVAPPNYGVKLVAAHDDTGRSLSLKSFQFTFLKGMWFFLELSEPSPHAKNVMLDVAFYGGGVQRAKWALPIVRDDEQLPFFVRRWWEDRDTPARKAKD